MNRWVLNSLFKVQAVKIDWDDEMERLEYEGPFLGTGFDPGSLYFRWLLHPALGLPCHPFILYRNRHPGGNLTKQELANLPGWEEVEIVGLPVDDWDDVVYKVHKQGPVEYPLLQPSEAALQRLKIGAPRIGWTKLTRNGISLDDWKSPDLEAYLQDMLDSKLLKGIYCMFKDCRHYGLKHADYLIRENNEGNDTGRCYDTSVGALRSPRLLLDRPVDPHGESHPVRSEWSPLGMLLVAVGTDPLAALVLGFGTSLFGASNPNEIYMVSVRHELQIGDTMFDFELADVVRVDSQLAAPKAPTNLSARIISRNRPQTLDGPALESIRISWERPDNPIFTLQSSNSGFPASYAVGRFGPHPVHAEILLARRPETLGGWFPFVASKPDEVRPVFFTDYILRLSNIAGKPVPDPFGVKVTYAVASQDIFGRWSPWRTVSFQGNDEQPQIPSVLSINIDPSGQVAIDFSWDWSDRSPEFIELIGAYADDLDNKLFTERVQFGGNDEPVSTSDEIQFIPLDPNLEHAAGWGGAQDQNPAEPGVRFYRLITKIKLDFAGKPKRIFQVQACGQCHIHRLWGDPHNPNFNVSPLSSPVSTHIYDPEPPAAPTVPEAPQWASLPDSSGVSRILLSWTGDLRVSGYVLYEATETSLLAALGLPGPDTSQPFFKRLAVLRAAMAALSDKGSEANIPLSERLAKLETALTDIGLPGARLSQSFQDRRSSLTSGYLRPYFRRVNKEPIPPTSPQTFYETSLPRGSKVIHFYAVTAMSHNQIESAWPDSSKKFIAVAVPSLAVPLPPTLQANLDPTQLVVHLNISLSSSVAVKQVELYRTTSKKLAKSADTMGSPLKTLNATGLEITFTDDSVTPGWRRIWYRAVAWSKRDDQLGLVEARSSASPLVSVLLPPQTAPDISDLRVNEPGSNEFEVLVSWTSHAPVEITPLGPHIAVLLAHDISRNLSIRLEGDLNTLLFVNSLAELPPANLADRKIIRVGPPDNYRLYAWIPRPAADQLFYLTVKMIDPLGRIGLATAEVPPLPTQ